MSDSYLWDPDHEPDPQLERLESSLRPLRFDPAQGPSFSVPPSKPHWKPMAAAAVLLIAVGAVLWHNGDKASERNDSGADTGVESSPYWLEALAGAPRLDGTREHAPDQPLAFGDRVICGEDARARLRVGEIGSVVLEPNSSLRLESPESADDGEYLLRLERGTLSASIFAAPRLFQVGTPAGIAVDLGCIYTATVEADGLTTLSVVSGSVSFETPQRKVYVPAGARTRAYPELGPGTPVWEDAGDRFRRAVDLVDRLESDFEAPLQELIDTGREQDSLTLWHLLSHRRREVRAAAYDGLARWAPPPAGVEREACLQGDVEALALWREGLAERW